jgi:predicted AAA+ superfamily ATPase
MIQRTQWIDRIERAWSERTLVWLAGVRRVGKTCLSQSLEDVEYFDCELPRIRRLMDDPEDFLGGLRGRRVVLDEIHRLSNPSELLKIAADHFPDVRVLATGSSTLGAAAKFRDTLTGRKRNVLLTPMTQLDMHLFGNEAWSHRFLRGGLPPFFISEELPERDYQEWIDAFWAKDIQELFRLERRSSFIRFLELILAQSGGIFEATKFARPCEVSRTTITNYLGVLEATLVAHVIRPYSTHRPTEIVSAPKVYGFDTGFVCAYRGWQSLRQEDMGPLWEHVVLNELQAHGQGRVLHYWRDKRGHEVDFILAAHGKPPIAIECKWSERDFDPANLRSFRVQYSAGDNYVVAHDVERTHIRHYRNLVVCYVNLTDLISRVFHP